MPVARSIPILVLAGQSNANNSDIVKATFDRAQAMGGLMVHLAVNGSPLSSSLDGGGGDWSASGKAEEGELFNALVRQLDGLVNPTSPTYVPGAYLEGMIWLHGGADIFLMAAAKSYLDNLASLNAAMTARFGAHDLVISGMPTASFNNRDMTDGQSRNWLTIQAAQTTFAAAHDTVHLVDPDLIARQTGLSESQMFQSDFVHYSSTFGYAAQLGKTLAMAALPGSRQTSEVAGVTYRTGTAKDDNLTVGASGLVQVWGGRGTDTVTLNNRAFGVVVTDTGPTNARIIGLGNGPNLYVDLIAVESLKLTAGADDVHLGGGISSVNTLSGNDKVIGSAAKDTVWLGNGNDYALGQGGNDRLFGGYGNDNLWGDIGDDALFGGRGNDRLGGGDGADTLTGGSGADVFVFVSSKEPDLVARDTITDFANGTDKMALQNLSWAQVTVTAQGRNCLIEAADHEILLMNIKPSQIDAKDFIFS